MATKKLQILGNLGNKIYTQNEEPIDAQDGTLWIDTDEYAEGSDPSTIISPVDSVNGKTGDVVLTAEDVGARSSNWMPTAEDVGATPASHVENKNNPHGVTAEQVGAVPLDTDGNAKFDGHIKLENTDEFYAIQKNRIVNGVNYRMTAGVGAEGQVSLETYNDTKNPSKYIARLDVNTDGMKFKTNGGEVEEWVNPPMEVGVEYRTTKRWRGKPVYTQVIHGGSLPGSGSVNIKIPTSGSIHYIISAKGSLSDMRVFPSHKIAGSMSIDLETHAGGIDVYVSHDWIAGSSFYVTVEYTKN